MKKFLEIDEELINVDLIKNCYLICYLIHRNGYGTTVDEIGINFIDGSHRTFGNGKKIFNILKEVTK